MFDSLDISYLPLDYIMIPSQIILAFVAIYFFILGVSGLVQFRTPNHYQPQKKFSVIVPAHNEELVIGPLIDNLTSLNYPKELYDVFVIADNCTDSTASIARAHGALVYERTNHEQKGKGYALEWFFAKLYNSPKKYDAVVIFDADNLVPPIFATYE